MKQTLKLSLRFQDSLSQRAMLKSAVILLYYLHKGIGWRIAMYANVLLLQLFKVICQALVLYQVLLDSAVLEER